MNLFLVTFPENYRKDNKTLLWQRIDFDGYSEWYVMGDSHPWREAEFPEGSEFKPVDLIEKVTP